MQHVQQSGGSHTERGSKTKLATCILTAQRAWAVPAGGWVVMAGWGARYARGGAGEGRAGMRWWVRAVSSHGWPAHGCKGGEGPEGRVGEVLLGHMIKPEVTHLREESAYKWVKR